MNLHQQLQQIQARRDRETAEAESSAARKWPSPIEDGRSRRRKLSLRGAKPSKTVSDRGPLRIPAMGRQGGYESIVERAPIARADEHRIEAIVDSRLKSFNEELPV
ncbi:MAG: hypothetical protein CBD18_02260 [Opitutales bacterium TMED158]|nr:MAG: hypothetical protein CBD18_02260 [Opitutales bacterium TMED158]